MFDKNHTVKICDLGLARRVSDEPPFTSYHATRWYGQPSENYETDEKLLRYRAPELLLGSNQYSTSVDMWALGCLMWELYTGRPLFPGTSEINQLAVICSIRGTISESAWFDGVVLAKKLRISLPAFESSWNESCIDIGVEAVQLMDAALAYDPKQRVTASEALSYPLFDISLL